METRLIVCGGLDFADYERMKRELDALFAALENVALVSGGARGADALAERYAAERGILIRVFPAEWQRYGKAAGPIRNRAMLAYARKEQPLVAAFWNGKSRGTANMLRQARSKGVPCRVFLFGSEHVPK